ncbi:MAG TPA: hypothetical protein PKA04_06135 [Marmoricola sp.]|nr:hypothetical protein [Marmoricola sp.]
MLGSTATMADVGGEYSFAAISSSRHRALGLLPGVVGQGGRVP